MRNTKTKTTIIVIVLLFFIFGPAGNAAAFHTYHSSLTKIDYNPEDKLFEITIRLFTHDVVPLMKSLAGDKTEKESEYDRILLRYLNENFELSNDAGPIGELVWVGKETKVDNMYVFVEIPYNGAAGGLKLKNTILFDLFPTQKNLVTVKIGEMQADLFFKTGDKIKDVQFDPKS